MFPGAMPEFLACTRKKPCHLTSLIRKAERRYRGGRAPALIRPVVAVTPSGQLVTIARERLDLKRLWMSRCRRPAAPAVRQFRAIEPEDQDHPCVPFVPSRRTCLGCNRRDLSTVACYPLL